MVATGFGRGRRIWLLWPRKPLMPVSSNTLKCSPACKKQFCDNMIYKHFKESGDDTADEYESDNIGDDNA